MSLPASITVTTNEIAHSARVEIQAGACTRPLAYRVEREVGSGRYVIRDPFGAAIDGVSTFAQALDIARGLAENVREWAGGRFDC